MDRLSILLTLMTGAVITGVVVITAFTLGYHNVWSIAVGAAVGFIAAWPVSYLVSRRIKRNDPNWHRTADPKVLPDPDAPEV